ncbi:hypothetical protein [Dyella silvae]|uniref:hypothetical protein n=1 Tax=Dyella silvae TaxID=2994424 RepID=UPI0022654040|nr:hypothetical protein [Dyella silvae]
MQTDLDSAIASALSTAKAYWELAREAVSDGALPRVQAVTMGKAATEGAALVRNVIANAGHRFSPELLTAVRESVADLETLAELAGLAVSYNLTQKNAPHLATAMLHTAAQAVRTLARTEVALRDANR